MSGAPQAAPPVVSHRVARAVAIGGGHGTSRTLVALRGLADHVTAVVTVADDGGSSGRLRRDLDVIAPGDLRMALAALAHDHDLAEVVQYRFGAGELEGHSLGNLLLVALADLAGGDVVVALDRLARALDVDGRVLPCTTTPVTLHATTGRGPVVGQARVARTPGLREVWLEPAAPPATPEAVAAIGAADLVVLGPGSLYTSLLPNLLVPDIAAAVAAARAPVVLVANVREQPGETEGMTLADHLDVLTSHVPEVRIDVLVAHEGRRPGGSGRPLELHSQLDRLRGHARQVVVGDLVAEADDGHDPTALATILDRVLDAAVTGG